MPVLNRIPLFLTALAMSSHREPLYELFLHATKFRIASPMEKPQTVATLKMNIASLDKLPGLFATPGGKIRINTKQPLRNEEEGYHRT